MSRIYPHAGFDFNAFDWDVAILELSSPVGISARIQPICLKTTETPRLTGRRATVIGWGRRREGERPRSHPIERFLLADISCVGDRWSSDSLRKVNVPVVNSKVCQRAYRLFRSISDRMLCAGLRRGGKDSCQVRTSHLR